MKSAGDWTANNLSIPESCMDGDRNTYNTGCGEALKKFLESNIYVVGGVAVAFGVIEVRALIRIIYLAL